ncbi:LacI family DNA-binding transcriptional regulator [Lachnoclostridium sp. Marseille-P6806]|uniref:LacI family DNA-binding transcriptional regulator n=1 Tax=Lachnoclostridium sp. Marseille-P6806 TaxID=2364793 RepID=UPI00102FD953|nr:LacI family DNA-binding transcriptional regulator [Lachnoclostridium sp. Marseille-P6806]
MGDIDRQGRAGRETRTAEMGRNTVRISDIAKAIGVSAATVSATLNGNGDALRIARDTQEKILAYARAVHYHSSAETRRSRMEKAAENPLVFCVFWRSDIMNERVGTFLLGLHQAALERGRKIQLVIEPYEPGTFARCLDKISASLYSGVVISGLSEEEQDELEKRDYDVPIVLIGRDSARFHYVRIDDFRAGENLSRMVRAGEVRRASEIGFVKGSRAERIVEAGFTFGCREAGIPIDESSMVRVERADRDSGYAVAMRLIRQLKVPEVWLVMDCRLAPGIMAACKESGVRIPEELRLIFFEDSDFLRSHEPTLSCIAVPSMEMAAKTMDILQYACENPGMTLQIKEELLPIYHFRESSGGGHRDSTTEKGR